MSGTCFSFNFCKAGRQLGTNKFSAFSQPLIFSMFRQLFSVNRLGVQADVSFKVQNIVTLLFCADGVAS